MTVVTPTDLPKSVRNRCVIEILGCVFVLSLNFYFPMGAFVIGFGQMYSFSLYIYFTWWLTLIPLLCLCMIFMNSQLLMVVIRSFKEGKYDRFANMNACPVCISVAGVARLALFTGNNTSYVSIVISTVFSVCNTVIVLSAFGWCLDVLLFHVRIFISI